MVAHVMDASPPVEAAREAGVLRHKFLAVLNQLLVLTSAIVFCLAAVVSLFITFKTWRNFASDVLSHDGGSGLASDPLVIAILLVTCCGFLEVLYVVSWIWIGAPLWLGPNIRTRPSCIRSCTLLLTFQLALFALVAQVVATFYLIFMDARFPNLHWEGDTVIKRTVETKTKWMGLGRATPTGKFVDEPERRRSNVDLLVAAMKTFRSFQPFLLWLYTLSCLLKTVFLKHYERLRKRPPFDHHGCRLVRASTLELLPHLLPQAGDDDDDDIEEEEEVLTSCQDEIEIEHDDDDGGGGGGVVVVREMETIYEESEGDVESMEWDYGSGFVDVEESTNETDSGNDGVVAAAAAAVTVTANYD